MQFTTTGPFRSFHYRKQKPERSNEMKESILKRLITAAIEAIPIDEERKKAILKMILEGKAHE